MERIHSTSLDLPHYIDLMHRLGFLSLRFKRDEEIDLISGLWNYIGAKHHHKINTYTLLILIAGVLNL